MSQLLKRWETSTFHLLGQPIQLAVKAIHFSEEAEFNRRMLLMGQRARPAQAAIAALRAGEELDTASLEALFSSVDPAWAAGIFEHCVRLPEAIKLEGEDGEITSGKQLFEVANGALVQAVLAKVGERSRLGAEEGKALSSPSTSDAAGTTPDGGSPATSTGSVDGHAR